MFSSGTIRLFLSVASHKENGKISLRIKQDMKSKVKWIWGGIFLALFLIFILIFSFRTAILTQAGKFMAPQGDYTADAAILEGSQFIERNLLIKGMSLLSSGKVRRIIIVLHARAKPFAFNDDYPDLVRKELKALGLKETDFRIVLTPVEQPVTLTEARWVAKIISKDDLKRAILLSQGFHTRRSYLTYQHVCHPFQIKIYPFACFGDYQPEQWWSQGDGFRDFATESFKLVYYLARGYIPFKFTYPLHP